MPSWTLTVNGSAVTAAQNVELRQFVEDTRTGGRLEFIERTKLYSGTWTEGQSVVLEYDTGTTRFTGKIVDKECLGDAGEAVRYVAYGWRTLAQNVPIVRYGASEAAPDPYPERIYNCADDDVDLPFRAGSSGSMTVGAIIQDLFDDHLATLRAEGACHASSTPYNAGDLSSLTRIPSKLVLSGQNFDGAIAAVLREQGPTWACWVDTTGVWRFWNRRDVSTTTTVTIGSDDVAVRNLKRNIAGRATAVRVIGKRGRGARSMPAVALYGDDEFGRTGGADLEIAWSPSDEATWTRANSGDQTDAGIVTSFAGSSFSDSSKNWPIDGLVGAAVIFPHLSPTTRYTVASNTSTQITLSVTVPSGLATGQGYIVELPGSDVFRKFRIVDSTKRDIVLDATGDVDCCPHVVGIIRNSITGNVTGLETINIQLLGDGYFRTERPLIAGDPFEAGASTLWPDFKLVYCYRDTATSPFQVRYPTSSYSGEASGSPWNVQREKTILLDELQDAVDTTAAGILAQELHKDLSRVPTSGSFDLMGMNWTYSDPRRRIHLAGTETTGWESLGASIGTVTYDFGANKTRVQLSDDGSGGEVDWRGLMQTIRDRLRGPGAAAELAKLGQWVDCRNVQRGRGNDTRPVDERVDSGTVANPNLSALMKNTDVEGTYRFPHASSANILKDRDKCRCDATLDPCNTNDTTATKLHGWLCHPDGQAGLIVKHPGQSATAYCQHSQLIEGDRGMYYPFTEVGVAIGNPPTDLVNGSGEYVVSSGPTIPSAQRDLVVVEPADIDDGTSGSQIGTAALLIQFLKSYVAYMQHNEDAHCCLDNRISCADRGVWGNSDCPNNECSPSQSIFALIKYLDQRDIQLQNCIQSIHYVRGEVTPTCRLTPTVFKSDGCGAC